MGNLPQRLYYKWCYIRLERKPKWPTQHTVIVETNRCRHHHFDFQSRKGNAFAELATRNKCEKSSTWLLYSTYVVILRVLEENEGSPVRAVEFPYIECLAISATGQIAWLSCLKNTLTVTTSERKHIWGRMFHREVARLFNEIFQ